ncbi:MAG: TetR/AcrR family transcriptional regulator [Bacillaceae bacterium]|nr:TetR/AcrR family transcriptional regulator [Bacillaceae bacterium]
MSLRQKRKEELKEQIFRESLRLFRDQGYDNVTVDQITRACGIAKGTFYNYFPKKEHLLLHLGLAQMEVLNESLQKYHNHSDIKEKIEMIFGDLFQLFENEWDLMSLALSEILRTNLVSGKEFENINSFQDALSSMLDEAKQQGQISKEADSDAIASTLIGIYFHTLLISLSSNDSSRLSSVFHDHLEVVWNGFKPL